MLQSWSCRRPARLLCPKRQLFSFGRYSTRRRVRAPNCAFWVAGGREYGARSFHESVGLDPIHSSRDISHGTWQSSPTSNTAAHLPKPAISRRKKPVSWRALAECVGVPICISQALPLATKKGKPPCLSMVAGKTAVMTNAEKGGQTSRKPPRLSGRGPKKWLLGLARVEGGPVPKGQQGRKLWRQERISFRMVQQVRERKPYGTSFLLQKPYRRIFFRGTLNMV